LGGGLENRFPRPSKSHKLVDIPYIVCYAYRTMKAELTDSQRKELDELFPFEYQGGGYFRMKGVKKGESAPILHGMEAIEYLFDKCVDMFAM